MSNIIQFPRRAAVTITTSRSGNGDRAYRKAVKNPQAFAIGDTVMTTRGPAFITGIDHGGYVISRHGIRSNLKHEEIVEQGAGA